MVKQYCFKCETSVFPSLSNKCSWRNITVNICFVYISFFRVNYFLQNVTIDEVHFFLTSWGYNFRRSFYTQGVPFTLLPSFLSVRAQNTSFQIPQLVDTDSIRVLKCRAACCMWLLKLGGFEETRVTHTRSELNHIIAFTSPPVRLTVLHDESCASLSVTPLHGIISCEKP